MKQRCSHAALGLVGWSLLVGCADGYTRYEGDEAESDPVFGNTAQAVNACEGDDLQYDFNGFAASLAVAIANELGHWDVATDFVVSNGKLALTNAGLARCSGGCENIKAILLMQEDVTGDVPYHSAAEFRSKLTGWYQAQQAKLVELTTAAIFPPGTYRLKGRQSNKFMVVDLAATTAGALIEQKSTLSGTSGDWELTVVGPKHKLRNVKSGMCLDLKVDSATNADMVQKPCSSADSQLFRMSKSSDGTAFLFETKHPGKGLFVSEDAKIIQASFDKNMHSSQWVATSLSGTLAQGLFKGMYTLKASHSNKVMGVVDNTESSSVAQYTYSATNPMLEWYASPMGANKYQFINRSTGKCMALATDSATAKVVQRACANNDSQKFTLTPNGGADTYTLKSRYDKLLEVDSYLMTDGAVIEQAEASAADPQRKFKLTPLLAGEPHRLSFSHTTPDAHCGDYFWFNITQPNGLPLANPAETYIQLIFAGGKRELSGADENPFIAQLSTGTQVAVDPSGYMLGGQGDQSGTCITSDILVDLTRAAGGSTVPPVEPLCCVTALGLAGKFVKSSWSPTTFLCRVP
jgi:hypothetical protein